MEKETKWKVITLILGSLLLICLFFIAYIFTISNRVIVAENECALNVCEEYPSYYYDAYMEVCYCYEGNEIVRQKYLPV